MKTFIDLISKHKIISSFLFVFILICLLFVTGFIKREGYCIDFVDKPGYCTKIAWVIGGIRLE